MWTDKYNTTNEAIKKTIYNIAEKVILETKY